MVALRLVGLALVPAAAAAAPYPRPVEVAARLHALVREGARRGIPVRVEEIGRSVQGRPILAAFVGRSEHRVLYVGTHHARERISADLVLRLAEHLVRSSDPRTARLAREREAVLVPVLNPDGYRLTFERGYGDWRKNARDNDGDGRLGPGDGVDLNRNYDWRWDAPRARPDPLSPEYRGPSPFSEPETRALRDLMASRRFAFAVSYHSFGSYLVYPEAASAMGREPPDAPLYRALAGDSERPAILGSLRREGDGPERYRVSHGNPEIGGRFDAWAYHRMGVPAFYVELQDGWAFDFPEDEAARARVLEDNLPFALDLLESAAHPADPVSHLGRRAPPIAHDPPGIARGDAPLLEALVRRDGGRPTLFYAGAGRLGWAPMALVERGVHYDRWAAPVPLRSAEVRYFLVAGAARLPARGTFRLRRDGPGGPRLVIARDVQRWRRRLERAGISAAFWEHGRPPDAASVLSAFEEVVWDAGPGVRAAGPTMHEVARFLAGGGRAIVIGAAGLRPKPPPKPVARFRPAPGVPAPRYLYPVDIGYVPGDARARSYGRRALRALVGAQIEGPARPSPHRIELRGRTFRLRGKPHRLSLAGGATPIAHAPGPRPSACERCWFSGSADDTLARVERRLDLRRLRAATLVVRAHWELEDGYDHFFVEACRSGRACTTLRETGGRSTQDFGVQGQRRWRAAWVRVRARELLRYLDPGEPGRRWRPRGTQGEWHGFTGKGGGELRFDLTPFAGGEVTIAFAYLADPHRHGRGVVLEEMAVPEIGVRMDARDPGWSRSTAFGEGRWVRFDDPAFRLVFGARRGGITVVTVSPDEVVRSERDDFLRTLLAGPPVGRTAQ